MKPRRRKARSRIRGRAVIKWTGAVVTVLLLVVWVGNRWCHASGHWNRIFGAAVVSGRVCFSWHDPSSISMLSDRAFQVYQARDGVGSDDFRWWFMWNKARLADSTIIRLVCIPIWSLALLTAIPTLLMFRTDRRRAREARIGLCRNCGYNLTGLPSGGGRACPECGTLRVSP